MGKYLVLWRFNYAAFPSDPSERLKIFNRLFQIAEEGCKNGELENWGSFLDGTHGYGIWKQESMDMEKRTMFIEPYIEILEIDEVNSMEDTKKIIQEVTKIKMEDMTK